MNELVKIFHTSLIAPGIDQLQSLGAWSYVLLALLVLIEGPISTFLGATAASAGWLNPALVFIAAVIGNMTADVLWYLLGYFSRVDWLVRKKWLKVSRERIAHLQNEICLHAQRIVFVAKLTHSLIIPTLIATGLARVGWRRWFGALLAAEFIWTGSLVLLGYYLGLSLQGLETGLQYLALAGVVIFLLVVGRRLWQQNS